MSHTPGPWGYERIGSGEFLITDPGPPLPGFKVSAVGKMGLNEDDARLAAAAPELLAALEGAMDWLRYARWDPAHQPLEWIRAANAAFAKVRGNQ